MKTIPIALAAHMALDTTTTGYTLRIDRPDGQSFGFTSASNGVIFDGLLYSAAQGLDVSQIVTTAGLGVDNMELTTLDDGTLFHKREILAGLWTDSAFKIARYNWRSPTDGQEILTVGNLGAVNIKQAMIVVELRGLQQYLQQPIGIVTSKNCRARLGDALCTKDLTAFTYTGTVTSVINMGHIIDTSRTEPTGWFNAGKMTFTSGANKALTLLVNSNAGSAIYIANPMFLSPAIGDTYTIVAGCTKRLVQDCFTKFNNVLNFQGEPHLPGVDSILHPVHQP